MQQGEEEEEEKKRVMAGLTTHSFSVPPTYGSAAKAQGSKQ